MSIEGAKNVPGGADNGGAEGLTEEQKKALAEEKAKADAAKTSADLTKGLTGKDPLKAGNEVLNGAGIFGNTGFSVDQEQLNDLTAKMYNQTMQMSAMPFGTGIAALQNSITAWFQAIMNCFHFNGSTSPQQGLFGGGLGGATSVVSSSGGTRLVDKTKTPDGYTATSNAGVFSKDGKFYKYEDGSYKLVECKADGTPLASQKPEGEEGSPAVDTNPKTETKPTTKPEPKTKTEADYAKEGGFVKLQNGCYRGKDGKFYKYENGSFTYYADMMYKNGQHTVNGAIYNGDGTKSQATVYARTGTPSIHTEEYYKNHGDYKVSSYNGNTVYSNDKETLYFDKAGKLVQKNYKANGFFEDQSTTVDRYTYDEKSGVLKSNETYNNRTGITTKKEYLPANGNSATAPTTTQSQPHTIQEMDSQGRVSTRTVVTYTTTEIKIEGNTAIKITTTQDKTVR